MLGTLDPTTLPQPGTPPFFPSLLSSIRTNAPNVPLDPVALQAVLLCLLAGNKNLILRSTREDDIGSVAKLTASTLTSVFGYPTHRLKIRSDSKHETPSEFLRTLFLRPLNQNSNPLSLSTSDDLSTYSQKVKATHKRRSGSRTPSLVSEAKARREPFPRSNSFPAIISPPKPGTPNTHANEKAYAVSTSSSPPQRPSLRPEGVHTDPSPSLGRHFSLENISLPRVLVISGLEHASIPSQRALLKVITDKSISLEDDDGDWIWNLPDGFMIIYVCANDPREHPAIHKSLLDRFAMSSTVSLHPSTQQAIKYSLPHHRISQSQSAHLSNIPEPIFPESFLEYLRSLAAAPEKFTSTSGTNIHPTLLLYLSDLFSAARHHPQLDGMLLTARSRQDAEALARAARVIGGDLSGVEFIQAMGKGAEARLADEKNRALSESFEDDMSWENGDTAAFDSSEKLAGYQSSETDTVKMLDVSEADIARIVPRVLSHRLRVRDGPEDETLGSLQHGAVAPCAEWEKEVGRNDVRDPPLTKQWQRSTVKDILVKILSEV